MNSMKYVLTLVLASCCLVWAQDTDTVEVDETLSGDTAIVIDDSYYAGASIGYPGVNFHFGIDNFTDNLDARATLSLNYAGSFFELGAAALYVLPIDLGDALESSSFNPLDIYLGGGPVLGFGGDFTFGLNLLGGGEYRLGNVGLPEGGVFLELGPQFDVVRAEGESAFGYAVRLGFNYHF